MAQEEGEERTPGPSRQQQRSLSDYITATKQINPLQDLRNLPSKPCARSSFLYGIVAGTAVGCLRFMFKGRALAWSHALPNALNWAVVSFGGGSIVAWHQCLSKKSAEQSRMNAILAELKARREAQLTDDKREARRSAKAGTGKDGHVVKTKIVMGEKGRELLELEEKKEQRLAAAAREEGRIQDQGKPWYRRWG
ncbi:hypothetical protein T439DRAFT_327605 [Meredithblackwellia eburnea MCA 4105]